MQCHWTVHKKNIMVNSQMKKMELIQQLPTRIRLDQTQLEMKPTLPLKQTSFSWLTLRTTVRTAMRVILFWSKIRMKAISFSLQWRISYFLTFIKQTVCMKSSIYISKKTGSHALHPAFRNCYFIPLVPKERRYTV